MIQSDHQTLRILKSSETTLGRPQRWSWARQLFPFRFKNLYGAHFVVQSDHQPLSILKSSDSTSGRLHRWSLALQPFSFRFEFLRGIDNVGADFFSRHFKFSSSLDPRYQNLQGLQILGGHMLQGVPPGIHQRTNKVR